MSDYKDMAVVCIPYKTFKERCKLINALIDEDYYVEYTDEHVIGVRKPKNRRGKNEISF